MEVVKLETQQIIAASVGLSTDEVPGGLSRELDLDVDLEDQNALINQLLGM